MFESLLRGGDCGEGDSKEGDREEQRWGWVLRGSVVGWGCALGILEWSGCCYRGRWY